MLVHDPERHGVVHAAFDIAPIEDLSRLKIEAHDDAVIIVCVIVSRNMLVVFA